MLEIRDDFLIAAILISEILIVFWYQEMIFLY